MAEEKRKEQSKPEQQQPQQAEQQSPAERAEQDAEQGYSGTVPDPTPNEHYTVQGVTSGKPTPETDDDARRKVREQQQR